MNLITFYFKLENNNNINMYDDSKNIENLQMIKKIKILYRK